MAERSEIYPNVPGFKAIGTSSDAAAAIAPMVSAAQAAVLAVLSEQPMTADEVAHRLGKSILTIRPRVCELKRLGLIKANGHRRRNVSGLFADVMELRA